MFKGKYLFNASFDVYADNYDEVRPGYPDAIFERIGAFCDLSQGSTGLEIGAGSGIATRHLADFGGKIIALEPGKNLIDIAKAHLCSKTNIDFVCETFESYRPSEKFDAIFAFTAFHWLTDEAMFQNLRSMLKPHGKLVIVWNSFFQDEGEVSDKINQLYHKWLPDVYPANADNRAVNIKVLNKLDGRIAKLASQDEFSLLHLERFVTKYHYDGQKYAKLLETFPKIIDIKDDNLRESFLRDIISAVESYGEVIVPVLSSLLILEPKDGLIESIVGNK